MAALTDIHRLFITKALACFDSPSQVAELVKEEFGVVVTRQQVQAYDPGKTAARHLSKKWRAIFDATRKAFLDDVSQIPIAQKAYRLRRLQHLHDRAGTNRNPVLAAALLEQAAKEIGGHYGDRRRVELAGPNGGPIPVAADLRNLTDAELATLENILSAAESRAGSPGVGATPA